MPSFLQFSSSSKTAPARPSQPTQIRNQFYNNMREFAAWHNWGTKPNHTKYNHNYIPMKDRFVKQFDYPAELKKVMEIGWKSAATPIGPRKPGFTLGAARPTGPADLATNRMHSPLRQGLGRAVVNVNDFDHIKLFEQVAAYAFRGDSRSPEQIKAAGGFYPPSMRTDDFYAGTIAEKFYDYLTRREGLKLEGAAKDDFKAQVKDYIRGKGEAGKRFAEYHVWRTVLDREQMHVKNMTNDSFLKAYVSTTRDVTFAREAAGGTMGGSGAVGEAKGMFDVFVYALRIKSGFLLKTGIGGISKQEGEIAHLGPVLWKNVYGFRRLGDDQAVYIRNLFDQEDNAAFQLVLASLSNLNYTAEMLPKKG